MIDKRELRIGNKVRSPKHNLEIVTIQGMTTNDIVMLEELSTYDFFSSIEPIPLTSELLQKLGFVNKGSHDGGKESWRRDDFEFGIDEGYLYFYDDNDCVHFCNARYLHTLQNIFFLVTEKELIINHLQP